MKKFSALFLVILISSILIAQDVKEEATKMDQFASKTGSILKFIDTNLPALKLSYSVAEVKIRKIISGGEIGYFLQISKEGKYDTKTASIAYEDLIEIIKALKTLKLESAKDLSLNPDYLENKFITEDGFQVGYYVSKGKLKWYLTLERYGSGNTAFVKDVESIESLFDSAKLKIEELKK